MDKSIVSRYFGKMALCFLTGMIIIGGTLGSRGEALAAGSAFLSFQFKEPYAATKFKNSASLGPKAGYCVQSTGSCPSVGKNYAGYNPGITSTTGAAYFDGNDRIVVSGTNTWPTNTEASVEIWVKPSFQSTTATAFEIFEKGNLDLIIYSDGSIAVDLPTTNSATSKNLWTNPGIVKDELWSQIVLTYGGSVAKIYYNGKLVAKTTYKGSVDTSKGVQNLTIGDSSNVYNPTSGFVGGMDEFKVYNKALTQSRILDMYNNVMYSN